LGGGTSKSTPALYASQEPQRVNAEISANAALVLINVACGLLNRQIAAQARAFEEEGGFTERLYRVRSERRRNNQ
jgi:four helix bundle suffix protein